MIKATPEQLEAAATAWLAWCRAMPPTFVDNHPRDGIEAALNAALNVAPAGDIRVKARKLAEQVEEEWAPDWVGTGNQKSAAMDRKAALETATDLIVAAFAAPPSTVPALVEAEKALERIAADIPLQDEGLAISRAEAIGEASARVNIARIALAKIKSALAATDNPPPQEK